MHSSSKSIHIRISLACRQFHNSATIWSKLVSISPSHPRATTLSGLSATLSCLVKHGSKMTNVAEINWSIDHNSNVIPRGLVAEVGKFAARLRRVVFPSALSVELAYPILHLLNPAILTTLHLNLPGPKTEEWEQLEHLRTSPFPNLLSLFAAVQNFDENIAFLEDMIPNMPRLRWLTLQGFRSSRLTPRVCDAVRSLADGRDRFFLKIISISTSSQSFRFVDPYAPEHANQNELLNVKNLPNLESNLRRILGVPLSRFRFSTLNLWTIAYLKVPPRNILDQDDIGSMVANFNLSFPRVDQKLAPLTELAVLLASPDFYDHHLFASLKQWLMQTWTEIEPLARGLGCLEREQISAVTLAIFGLDLLPSSHAADEEKSCARVRCLSAFEEAQPRFVQLLLNTLCRWDFKWIGHPTVEAFLTCSEWIDPATGKLKGTLNHLTEEIFCDSFLALHIAQLCSHPCWNDNARLESGQLLCEMIMREIGCDATVANFVGQYSETFLHALRACVRLGLRNGRWSKVGSEIRRVALREPTLRNLLVQYLSLDQLRDFSEIQRDSLRFWTEPEFISAHVQLLNEIIQQSGRFNSAQEAEEYRSSFIDEIWKYLLAGDFAHDHAESCVATLQRLAGDLPHVVTRAESLPYHVLLWIEACPSWQQQLASESSLDWKAALSAIEEVAN